MITRFYVKKRDDFQVKSESLKKEIEQNLHIGIKKLDIYNVYDIKNLDEDLKETVKNKILSEPNVDKVYEDVDFKKNSFRLKLLDGQFDQTADSAKQCIEITTLKSFEIETSKLYMLNEDISKDEIKKIKKHLINPVEMKEVKLKKPKDINDFDKEIKNVEIIDGFLDFKSDELNKFKVEKSLAMDIKDLKFIQNYFSKEKRDPTITEIKVLDTYWSDHCRHTTFLTKLKNIKFEENDIIKDTFNRYLEIRDELDRKKDISLMDLGTIMSKYQRVNGRLDDLDVSDEINACTIERKVKVNGKEKDYFILFKNETHNHPTEIEPFGGASTCLGGAIRDPLAGRGYVYQSMRITGAANPNEPIKNTLKGKLPQRVITKKAAEGFSSYGNQIGLATGLVDEVYDEGFLAKRMEVGAVVASTPKKDVVRKKPKDGDLILLIGGKTGRDGCGGATGSSKKHSEKSIKKSGAEVQKGNAPEERKLQRLFRISKFSKRIKKCNDFGAGGVSVAIGELADSIEVNLDKIKKKYEGLDGTELAISESQERMAIVIDSNDLETIKSLCKKENVEATVVAKVTNNNRFIMKWREKEIFNISRKFLKTNGVMRKSNVFVESPKEVFKKEKMDDLDKKFKDNLSDLNRCNKKGLVEMFDSTVGANTLLMPFGGKYKDTPIQTMAAKVYTTKGESETASLMSYGYDPKIGKKSPFHGGIFSVLSSISKIVATGGDYKTIRLSFQEYFESLGNDPKKWAKPFSTLLGALKVKDQFNLAAIGGKDSMSGTFNDISVPPTLISFALTTKDYKKIISPEFKKKGNYIYLLNSDLDSKNIPDFKKLKNGFEKIYEYINKGKIKSAYAIDSGGISEAISKMAFGNKLGINLKNNLSKEELFKKIYGSIIFESNEKIDIDEFDLIGKVVDKHQIIYKKTTINLDNIKKEYDKTLDNIFPRYEKVEGEAKNIKFEKEKKRYCKYKVDKPKVFIPAFPGTNCEDDTLKAFEKVGAKGKIVVFNNMNKENIKSSIDKMAKVIRDSHIIAIPGGFSAGDEPEGSGKFIASVFRNEKIKEAVNYLLNEKDGLIIGICNGFQALIKLGLLPYGKIKSLDKESPTLTFNKNTRHISTILNVKLSSNKSPWLQCSEFGKAYKTPMSHGEGRFYAKPKVIDQLIKNGQIATQYADNSLNATMDKKYNPNGSVMAVEGITSKDGKIFGKMGHVERIYKDNLINIYNKNDMKIFESGVKYFTHN